MPDLSGVGYFLLLLGVLVAVHEFGHFIVAKSLGVKVLKFSIGFGPRLIGFTRGETEYRISLLPLGGYVKMAGELPYEELPPEEARRGFLAQPPWKRMLIIAAGPAFNLIFPILVFFFVYLGDHKAISSKVGSVEQGLPAAMAGIKPGDRITEIDGEPIRTFDELREVLKTRYGQEVSVALERDGQPMRLKLTPTSGIHDDHVEKVRHGFIGVAMTPKPAVIGVPEGSVAFSAGLRTFDRVLRVNDQPVGDEISLSKALTKAEGEVTLQLARYQSLDVPGVRAHLPKLLTVKVPRQPGEGVAAIGAEPADLYISMVLPKTAAANAGIKVGDRLLAINDKPLLSGQTFALELSVLEDKPFRLNWRSGGEERSAELAQAKQQKKDALGNKINVLDGAGIGFGAAHIAEAIKPEIITVKMSPGDALKGALKIVPEFIRKTVTVVGGLFTGRISTDTVGGPIMMYQLAQHASEEGWGTFLQLMGFISINLGVMNLLPIPILDGFGLLSALWEAVRRRPIPMRAREVANVIGLAMLVMLMVLVFWNDIKKVVERNTDPQQQQ